MVIKIFNANSEEMKEFKGDEAQLIQQLDKAYPYLKRYNPEGIQGMVMHLRRHQHLFVEIL